MVHDDSCKKFCEKFRKNPSRFGFAFEIVEPKVLPGQWIYAYRIGVCSKTQRFQRYLTSCCFHAEWEGYSSYDTVSDKLISIDKSL